MPLAEGARLGLYEILAPLGAGGMGEVYRARDTKLGRDVAVKVLPEHFAEDKDRMARFEREARVLASLNHPNIAAVYGLEESGGTHFLVMELVPGESLASKLKRGPLSSDEAMKITRQLIDALEAAHESGVVHRDLKPANVQLTPEGHVKVLDFGLAKVETGDAPSTETSLSPTMTRDATQAGIILGTAPYMSPEQARGLPVDKRSDIFAFGCVVFEMLTGQKAFEGDLVSDVMASVIKSEPNWALLPRPAAGFRKLLARCLDKDPKKRLRDIGDARSELDEGARLVEVGEDRPAGVRVRWAVALASASFAAGAIAVAIFTSEPGSSSDASAGVVRLRVELTRPGNPHVALSRDGRTLVSGVGLGLDVHRLDSWETRALEALEGKRSLYPFLSPDGEWIAYLNVDDSGFHKIRITGGSSIRLSDGPEGAVYGSWTDDGTMLFGGTGGIWEVDESGGPLRRVVTLPDSDGATSPVKLPDGVGILFQHDRGDDASVAVFDARSEEVDILVAGGVHPSYVDAGYITYLDGGTLMAVAFDVETLSLVGEAMPMIEGVGRGLTARMGGGLAFGRYSVSPSGTLAYFPATADAGRSRAVVAFDPSGTGDVVTLDWPQLTRDPRASPDGTRLAGHGIREENDVWVYDLERRTTSRLSFVPGEDETPVWSPDGSAIAFAGQHGARTVYRVPADGSEAPEVLWESERHAHVMDWSPDGRWLVLDLGAGEDPDVWLLAADGSEDRALLDSRFEEKLARLSPDGRYLAYVSDESGQEEVYVQRFPTLGDKRSISNDGGTQPVWSRDGRRLFYRSSTHVMAVDVRTEPAFEASPPAPLFEDTYMTAPGGHSYWDVLPDGRFVMLDADAASARAHIHVVVNWVDELRARVPAR